LIGKFPFLIFISLLSLLLTSWNAAAHGSEGKTTPPKSYQDWGSFVQQTDDGGFIIAGTTYRLGGWRSYLYLIKVDSRGNPAWRSTFGRGDVDWGQSAQQTTDGGYIAAGTTWNRGCDVYLVKADADGKESWSHTFGGRGRDYGRTVRQSADGGFVIVGDTASFGADETDVYLIKTDSLGKEVWSRHFGGSSGDYGHSVRQTRDGGYVIAGWTGSFGAGKEDVYLIRTDADGRMVWYRSFGDRYDDRGNSVQETSDGGFIIGGAWGTGENQSDVCLIKTDGEGREVWKKTYGGSHEDCGWFVQPTTDGGYVIVGNTWPVGKLGTSKVYLVKTDEMGWKVWDRILGGPGYDYGYCVTQTTDGGYVIVGKTDSFGAGDDDIYLIKTDAYGKEAWSKILR